MSVERVKDNENRASVYYYPLLVCKRLTPLVIKNFAKCQLYAFQKRKGYEQQGYKILPDAYIKRELLADKGDEILRFIATIKLKEATTSQLFKRLNSYSRQHPLYHALKEFGKIPKSDFLLRYIDILELRLTVAHTRHN